MAPQLTVDINIALLTIFTTSIIETSKFVCATATVFLETFR